MKKCPKCNRTFADDGFTFCLEDGALLSAPYDVNKTDPIGTTESGGAPRTVLMPSPRDAATPGSRKEHQLPLSTIAAPRPTLPESNASTQARTNSKLFYVLPIGVVMILVVGVLMFLSYRRGQCLKISVDCHQGADDVYCTLVEDHTSGDPSEVGPALASLRVVLGLQQAAAPLGVSNITWTSSGGKLINREGTSVAIETAGLAGQEITITAKYTTAGFMCSNQSSATIVVNTPTR